MENKKPFSIPLFLCVLLALLPAAPSLRADWLKTNNPPDIDKAGHSFGIRNTG